MNEKIQLLEKQLNVINSDPQADPRQKIDTMNDLAWELRHFDPQRALALSNTVYEFSQSQDYPRGQLHSLRTQTALHTFIFSKSDKALFRANQALDLLETCPDELAHAHILECLSKIYKDTGDYPAAQTYLMQALALCRQEGDQHTESMLLNDLGHLYYHTNDEERGLEYFEQALKIAKSTNDQEMQARMMNNIGDLLNNAGRYDEAFPYLEQSLALTRQFKVRSLEPVVLDSLSEIYAVRGNYNQALECLQLAYQLAEEFDDKSRQLIFLRNMARVYQRQQELDTALDYLRRALAAAEATEAKAEMFTCHQLLAEVYEVRREPEKSLFHHKQFHAIKEEIFNEKSDQKLKTLQVIHETETARQAAEIYRLKNIELQTALEQVKQLSGLLPICANCKKIRDDKGYWQLVEVYIRNHSEADFSHGICPECMQILYPEFIKKSGE